VDTVSGVRLCDGSQVSSVCGGRYDDPCLRSAHRAAGDGHAAGPLASAEATAKPFIQSVEASRGRIASGREFRRPGRECETIHCRMAESETPPVFESMRVEAGSVSKAGALAALEFVADGERLWLTVPVGSLRRLSQLCLELDALAIDAKNGVASHWHILTEKAPPEDHT
jgi:hypothetical protein